MNTSKDIDNQLYAVSNNSITILRLKGDPAFFDQLPFLTLKNLPEFFKNKQIIGDTITQNKNANLNGAQTETLRAIKCDKTIVQKLFERITRRNPSEEICISRTSHPHRGAMLHILPRLLSTPEGQSPLQFIERNLAKIRSMGFEGVMIGVVDRQTCDIYYGIPAEGLLIPCVNNHGYWSSGQVGIDPHLGSLTDYMALIDKSEDAELMVTQDTIIGTLGYPAQIAEFATSSLSNPTRHLMIGEKEVDICDATYFIHDYCIPDECELNDDVSSAHYAEVIGQSHVGSAYLLPKPNLFIPEVLDASLQRSFWQIQTAGVRSFRIDMAKHFGIKQLQTVIGKLRAEVANTTIAERFPQPFSVLLEYWALKYRDLKFATASLEHESSSVYFYDFPLAQALQDILLNHKSYRDTVTVLLDERKKWDIHLYQLIPTFIDHDFNFRPIYNGDYDTRAMVVVGYAMSMMLSANAPYVYFGFENARAGVPDIENYASYTEAHSRRVVSEIFSTSDPKSPAEPIAHLFDILGNEMCIKHWQDDSLVCQGDMNSVVISRTYSDPISGTTTVLEASFSRFFQDDTSERTTNIIYAYCHGPSVIIRKFTSQFDSDAQA